jgi:predicted nucleic acid-binding protein
VEVDIPLGFPRDQKDAKFLACALAAQANYFITGDRDFAEALKLVTTTILPVSLFKKLVCDTEV